LAVLVWSTAKAGGAMLFRDESRGKPEWVGVNASEHLSFARLGKASRGKPRRKPESTFRDRRGASVNVVMVGSDLPRNRKSEDSEDGTPPPTTGATELYPDHVQFCERHTSSSARSPGRNSLGLLSRVQPQLGAL